MKINGTPNNSIQDQVLLDTFIAQISALQEDVAQLQEADRTLDTKISQQLSEDEFRSFQASGHVTELHAGKLDASDGEIGQLKSTQADILNLEADNAEIQDLTAITANIPTLTTDDITVQGDITSSGDIKAEDADFNNVTADKINASSIKAELVESDINADSVVAENVTVNDKLTVNDIEVSGTVTGLSEVNADSVNANEAKIETADIKNIRSWVSQVLNQEESLLPSPSLGATDKYTIELPRFSGVYLISWENNDVVWSATVIGNGKSYGISWSSRTEENFITDLFQYNGKLYIRVISNGRMKFSFSATKELSQPVIYFNMSGWTSDKSIEELCDEGSHITNVYPIGTVWFGHIVIPKLETVEGEDGSVQFKGSCNFEDLPSFADVDVGDIWNIANEAYTDKRFVEGAGKPINAGDDIVAIASEISPGLTLEKIDGAPRSLNTISTDDEAVLLFPAAETESISGVTTTVQEIYKYDGISLTKAATVQIPRLNSDGFYSNPIKTNTGRIIVFSANSYPTSSSDTTPIAIYSDDNGDTWDISYADRVYYSSGVNNMSAATVTPDGTIYITGGEESNLGLRKSIDNGATFTRVEWSESFSIGSLIALQDGSLLASDEYTATYKSTDGGETWTQISNNRATFLYQFSNGVIIANRAYSTDNGVTWQSVSTLTSFPVEPSFCEIDSVYYSSNGFKSTDGITWERNVTIQSNRNLTWRGVSSPNKVTLIYTYGVRQGSAYVPARYVFGTLKKFMWDKFAAGVNYDDFAAKNITATDALKSTGTLEVDSSTVLHGETTVGNALNVTGTSTFVGNVTANSNLTVASNVKSNRLYGKELHVNNTGDDVPTVSYLDASYNGVVSNVGLTENGTITHTGNYNATGNLNRTGNETISGLVTIGELN